jgi:hypothetical protein
MLTGCTLGYFGGTPRFAYLCVWLCIFLGCMTHRKRNAWHCTGTLGELAPPEGYLTSTHVGFFSCSPSLRVRLRSHALADTLANALGNARANTADDTLADAHAYALGNARADHRCAGHCAVGYEPP